jgi:hypothetical protein
VTTIWLGAGGFAEQDAMLGVLGVVDFTLLGWF